MKNAVMSVSNRSENFVAADVIENPLLRQMNCHYLIEVLLNNLNESVNIKQFTDEFVLMMSRIDCSEGTKLHSHKKFVLETDFLSLGNWIFAQLKEATKKNSRVYIRLAANGFKVDVSIDGFNRFVKLSKRSTSSKPIKNYIQLNQLKDSVSEEVSSDNNTDLPKTMADEFSDRIMKFVSYDVKKVNCNADCPLISNEEYLAEDKHLPQIKTQSVKAA